MSRNLTAASQVAAAQPGGACMACPRRNLELIFSLQFERKVNCDNTASWRNLVLQIEPTHLRATLPGCNVTVHQHLHNSLSLTYGLHRLGQQRRSMSQPDADMDHR